MKIKFRIFHIHILRAPPPQIADSRQESIYKNIISKPDYEVLKSNVGVIVEIRLLSLS